MCIVLDLVVVNGIECRSQRGACHCWQKSKSVGSNVFVEGAESILCSSLDAQLMILISDSLFECGGGQERVWRQNRMLQ